MATQTLDGTPRMQLTDRMALLPESSLRGSVQTPTATPRSRPGVLGPSTEEADAAAPPLPTLGLRDFTPAQPAIEVNVSPPPAHRIRSRPPTVLGAAEEDATAEMGMVEFQPDPGENASYAMLHEIHTPHGVICDVTLPMVEFDVPVLSRGDALMPGPLRFPVHMVMSGPPRPTDDRLSRGERDRGDEGPAVLGGVSDLISDVVEEFATKHILHVLKSPIDAALRHVIEQFEEKPFVMMMGRDGSFIRPLDSAEVWRARFNPAREHRVLLFIHGFNSNLENSNPVYWIEELGARYDAILGYNHPTITRDPIQNAVELLSMVPPDVRLNVDVVAHSRGGLVARSLVELQPIDPKLNIQRIVTCGSPHGGTTLADRKHWDRLVSIGFTAANWVGRATGAGLAFGFVSQGLELLLRAGSQSLFDLPGIEAMDPASPFLQKLNAPSDLLQRVPYAVVVSDFDPAGEQNQLVQALTSMAANVFFRVNNDLIVPTNSMSHIDEPHQSLPAEHIFSTNVDHFAYFSEHPEIRSFGVNFLLA